MRWRYFLISVVTLFAFGMLAVSSYAKINPKNIAAMWLFDEGSGETATDSSGNENHGKFMNGVKRIDGVFRGALELDGQDDHVFVAGSPSLDITDNITITAWVKHVEVADSFHKIFHYRRAGTSGGEAAYQFRWGPPSGTAGRKLEFQTNTAAGGWIHSYSEPDAIVDTDWHHYAVTASKGAVKMYIDGEPVKVGGSVAPKFDDGDQGYIGARVDRWNEYFHGSFDEIAIFNVVLNDGDIKDIATRGLAAAVAVSPAGRTAATWGSVKRQLAK